MASCVATVAFGCCACGTQTVLARINIRQDQGKFPLSLSYKRTHTTTWTDNFAFSALATSFAIHPFKPSR